MFFRCTVSHDLFNYSDESKIKYSIEALFAQTFEEGAQTSEINEGFLGNKMDSTIPKELAEKVKEIALKVLTLSEKYPANNPEGSSEALPDLSECLGIMFKLNGDDTAEAEAIIKEFEVRYPKLLEAQNDSELTTLPLLKSTVGIEFRDYIATTPNIKLG